MVWLSSITRRGAPVAGAAAAASVRSARPSSATLGAARLPKLNRLGNNSDAALAPSQRSQWRKLCKCHILLLFNSAGVVGERSVFAVERVWFSQQQFPGRG